MKIPTIVAGLQWGDEGKGKIVDYLAAKTDLVVRFNGGNNAGHTVVTHGQVFKFHHLPSGALQGKKLFIAQGEVINPKVLLEEIEQLRKQKIRFTLAIDPRVHIVMPYHQWLDAATEDWKGGKATGSLKLGIGYCYEDKNNRLGIRLEDLMQSSNLREKIEDIFPLKKAIIEKVFGGKVETTAEEIYKEYLEYGKKLKPFLTDVAELIFTNLSKKNMLFEAAHGTFLDPAFGTYPYTVAPYCLAASAFTGIGIGPMKADVVGILKAYTTRVGNGPFITEQKNKIGDTMQMIGQEVGTTSGRKRRCGWLDLPMLRTAVRLNGCTTLVLTKLDVLSAFPKICIATHYISSGQKLNYFPAEMSKLPGCRPVYTNHPGWLTPIDRIRKFSDLPDNCRKYILYIEKQLGLPIKYISVGKERRAVIKR